MFHQQNWSRVTTHPTRSATALAGSSTCRVAAASYTAATNMPPAHLAKTEHVYVHVCGQQKPLVAPYASPFRMVSKRTLTIQVGQRQETISMDRLKAHTGLSPVAPVKAASAAAPPRSQPLLHSSLHLHEAKEWVGGHVEDPMVVYLNIYFVCVSHYYGAIEAINLCM
jgi:hypothetical protein